MATVLPIPIRYRPGVGAAIRLLEFYLATCPHGEGKALARLPHGRACWDCYVDAFMVCYNGLDAAATGAAR